MLFGLQVICQLAVKLDEVLRTSCEAAANQNCRNRDPSQPSSHPLSGGTRKPLEQDLRQWRSSISSNVESRRRAVQRAQPVVSEIQPEILTLA